MKINKLKLIPSMWRICEYLCLDKNTVFTESLELTQKYRFIRFAPPLQCSKQPKAVFVGTEHHLEVDDKPVITIHLLNSAFNLSQQSQPQEALKFNLPISFLVWLDVLNMQYQVVPLYYKFHFRASFKLNSKHLDFNLSRNLGKQILMLKLRDKKLSLDSLL